MNARRKVRSLEANMSRHTPGPWRRNNTLITAQGDMALSVASVYPHSAEPGYAPRTPEQYQANASLIAAAPELLAFAEAFEQWFASASAIDAEQGKRLYSLQQKARSVIAKATGEATK
jgi:hypothetical protein